MRAYVFGMALVAATITLMLPPALVQKAYAHDDIATRSDSDHASAGDATPTSHSTSNTSHGVRILYETLTALGATGIAYGIGALVSIPMANAGPFVNQTSDVSGKNTALMFLVPTFGSIFSLVGSPLAIYEVGKLLGGNGTYGGTFLGHTLGLIGGLVLSGIVAGIMSSAHVHNDSAAWPVVTSLGGILGGTAGGVMGYEMSSTN